MNEVLEKLHWRYATKKFATAKKVSKGHMEILLEAARMTASSYGLQPYHFYSIEDKEIRSKLKAASWGQPQITDASHLLVLANQTAFDEKLVDSYIDKLVKVRGVARADLADYAQMMKSNLMGLADEQKSAWTAKQAYIVLGNVLTIAAEMKIDVCPMEGFDHAQYNEILGLTDKNLNAAVVMAIGYRADDDQTQYFPKVRSSKEQISTHI